MSDFPVLPHSYDAEKAVLGCVLVRGNPAFKEVAHGLSERSWYAPNHSRVWRAIEAVDAAGAPIDLLTVTEELERRGETEIVEEALVPRLMNGIPKLTNLEWYARIVREGEARRALVRHAQELTSRAAEDPLAETVEWSSKRVQDIGAGVIVEDDKKFDAALGEVLDEIEARQQAGESFGLKTGFADLDWHTAGLEAGDFVIVAGRTSCGKTSFAMNIVRHVAFRLGKVVVVHSMEMNRKLIAMRLACQEGGMSLIDARRGVISEKDLDAMGRVYARLRGSSLIIDDDGSATLSRIVNKCRRRRRNGPIGLIVIDQLGNVQSDSGRRENRTQDVSAISHGLKALAREMECPVIAMHQLNRSPEGGGTGKRRRPMLADLRDSGDIENDADVVLLMYREDQGDPLKPKTGAAELNIAKQRNGPTGLVHLHFDATASSFKDAVKFKP